MKKMTKTRAIEIAVVALSISETYGDIQGAPFDEALECLEKFYNISKLQSEIAPVESLEDFAKRNGLVLT